MFSVFATQIIQLELILPQFLQLLLKIDSIEYISMGFEFIVLMLFIKIFFFENSKIADNFSICCTTFVYYIFHLTLLVWNDLLKVGNLEFRRYQLFGMKIGINSKMKVCFLEYIPSLFSCSSSVVFLTPSLNKLHNV